MQSSGPNQTSQPRAGLTPHAGVPFVRVTGNPRGGGRERDRHAADELREVAMLRGRDDTGRQRVISPTAVNTDILPRGSAANDGADFVALYSGPIAAEPYNLEPFFGIAIPIVSTIFADVFSLTGPNRHYATMGHRVAVGKVISSSSPLGRRSCTDWPGRSIRNRSRGRPVGSPIRRNTPRDRRRGFRVSGHSVWISGFWSSSSSRSPTSIVFRILSGRTFGSPLNRLRSGM